MDRFGREEFRQLLGIEAAPAVSIYMPIERQEMTNKALRLQLRAQVDEAITRLEAAEDVAPSIWKPMANRLQGLVEERNFWNHRGDGVAIFAAPDFGATYFLPVPFEAQTVVGQNFHTRPLLAHVAAPTDYWVLAIGEKEVSFWEGSPTGVEAVEIEALPKNLQDALRLEFGKDQDGLNYQSGGNYSQGGASTSQGGTRSLPSPIYHGHGGGREEHDAYLARYFMEVSRGIRDYLGGAEGPVILAAVDYCHPIFKQASKLSNLAEQGINGNVHHWNDKQIYEAAWPIARQVMDRRIDETLQMWERAFGQGKTEMDLATVGRRVIEGRVHRLLLDEEAEQWGHYNRTTGEIELVEASGKDDAEMVIDIYDEIAEAVIELGGEVVVMPADKIPSDTGIGAILRG